MVLAEQFSNIGNTAAVYAGVAGVLAGFAFTALLGYLRDMSSEAEEGAVAHRSVAAALFSTLGALVISAILYAEQAGGAPDSGTAFSSVLVKGPAFGLAILGMFYATGLAATPFPHLQGMLMMARVLTGVVGPAITMIIVAAAALDISVARCTQHAGKDCAAREAALRYDQPFTLGVVLTLALVVYSLVLLIILRNPASPAAPWLTIALSTMIMAISVLTVAGSVYLGSQVGTFLLPDGAIRAILVVTALALAGASTAAIRACHYVPAVHEPSMATTTRSEHVSESQSTGRSA